MAVLETRGRSAAPRVRRRHRPRRWLLVAVLTALAVVTVFPLYWMVVSALTPGGQSQSGSFSLFPAEPSFDNYAQVFSTQPVWRWLGNSALIMSLGTALSVVVSLMAGYALVKFRFLGRGLLYAAFLVTIMIPIQVTIVPSFLVVAKMGLVDSPWAVILPTLSNVVGIFIARQFMLGVPDALMRLLDSTVRGSSRRSSAWCCRRAGRWSVSSSSSAS